MTGVVAGLIGSLKAAVAAVINYFYISNAYPTASIRSTRYIRTVFDSNGNYYSFFDTDNSITPGLIVKRNKTTGNVIWAFTSSFSAVTFPESIRVVSDGIYFASKSGAVSLLVKIDFNGAVTDKKYRPLDLFAPMALSPNLNYVTSEITSLPYGKGTVNYYAPVGYSYSTNLPLAKSKLVLTGNQQFVGNAPKIIANSSNQFFLYGTGDSYDGSSRGYGNVYIYTIGSTSAYRYSTGVEYSDVTMSLAAASSGNFYLYWDINVLGTLRYNLTKVIPGGSQTTYSISGVTKSSMNAMVVDSSENNLYILCNFAPALRKITVAKISLSGTWSVAWEKTITVGTSGTLNYDFSTITYADLDANGDLVFGIGSNTVTSIGFLLLKLKSNGTNSGPASGSDISLTTTSTISLSSGGTSLSASTSTLSDTTGSSITSYPYTVTTTDATTYYNSSNEVRTLLL